MKWQSSDDRLRLKEYATAALARVDVRSFGLWRVDSRLHLYCKEVATNAAGHNVWEQLAVLRFFDMCRRYGLAVDYVRMFFAFYESLTFVGDKGATSFALTPVQCFQFAAIFGFWSDEHTRVVKEAVLFVPRKFSKTTSSAAFVVWDLFFGDANAECYTGANSADQAKKCFNVIRRAVQSIDPGARRFIVNEEIIKSIVPGRSCFAQCLTANARTKDGTNASTIVMDEYSQARDSGLLDVLTTSMGVRRNPLTVIITTASEVFTGPFYAKLKGYKDLLAGETSGDGVFAHLFEPDAGDDEGDPATWHKVHPHLGITVRETFYAEEWEKAQREGGGALLAFRSKMLNLYTPATVRAWMTRKDVEPVLLPFDEAAVSSRNVVAHLGVDLSQVDDLTVVAAAYYNKATARSHIVCYYFFPADALNGHINEHLYRKWAEEGFLHLTDGAVVDYAAVRDRIRAIAARVPVIRVAIDKWGATDLKNYLAACGMGRALWDVPQTYGYFTDPVFALEKWVKERAVDIDPNPITLWGFDNCFLDENSAGQKPRKRTESGKIDGVIASLMAVRSLLYWER